MGFLLHFLILLHSFVAGTVTSSSIRLTSYEKVDDSAVGMTTLGTVWMESSLLDCARACNERETTCHCFAYNENTGQCTPGNRIIPMHFDVPSTGVDMYTSPEGLSCGINSGSEIHAFSDVTVCLWISTSKATFTAAEQSCKDKGANLVTFQTPEKKDMFFPLFVSNGLYLWVGLDDRNQEDTFTWHSDGSVLTAAQRADLFAPDRPSGTGGEDCVFVDPPRNGLNDDHCSKLYLYACEINIQHYR